MFYQQPDDKTGYDYICTHIDDFKIVVKDPTIQIDHIDSVFLIKEHEPLIYYLGNDYNYHDGENMWTHGVQIYAKEDVSRVEIIYDCLPKDSTPMLVTGCHLELDNTSFLGFYDHRKFQIFL